MQFFNVVSEEEALNIISETASGCSLGTETIPILEAEGRVLAQEVVAKEDVPAFNRSTVDGYAVLSNDSHGATETIPAILDMKGAIDMGQVVTQTLASLETMYVPTGGMLPHGADSVVMIEDAEVLDEETIAAYRAVTAGDNVIHKGDDIKKDAVALEKNRQLSSVDIGVLSALGIHEVKVRQRMKVTILSTGDEIVPLTAEADLGQIYDINGNVVSVLSRKLGLDVVHKGIVKDDYQALYDAVKKGTESSDLVILSGGSSVGTRDFTYDVIDNLDDSEMLLKGIAVKPGKPTILGKGNGSIIFGLPGHPVSSIMIFRLFVQPLIEQITGAKAAKVPFSGILTENVHGAPGRTTYQMVTVEVKGDQMVVSPVYGRSGMISMLADAQGYVRIPPTSEGLEAGSSVVGYYL